MWYKKLLPAEEKRAFAFWALLSLLLTITITAGEIKAEVGMEKLATMELQRQKDMTSANFLAKLNPLESHEATGSSIVVDTIAAPDVSEGLAWDNGYLWTSVGHYAAMYPGTIFNIDPLGNILSSFGAPGQSSLGPYNSGLAHDGTYLWSVDFVDEKIYKLSKSGVVLGSIPAPGSLCSGLAWDGENLWVSDWFSYKIYKLDPVDGEILMSFNAPDYEKEYPYGLAWDGAYLWASNSTGIYMIDPATGAVLSSCNDTAVTNGQVYGLTWDGEYLWGGSWVSGAVIKMDVSTFSTPTIPLPTSPGSFSYVPTASPLISSDPFEARPVGVGPVAAGGENVSLRVSISRFSGSADIYFGIYMPAIDPGEIYILTSDNTLRRFSAVGLVPWKADENGAVNESIFGDIPVSDLPAGRYTLYLMATPAGDTAPYYRWSTNFDIP